MELRLLGLKDESQVLRGTSQRSAIHEPCCSCHIHNSPQAENILYVGRQIIIVYLGLPDRTDPPPTDARVHPGQKDDVATRIGVTKRRIGAQINPRTKDPCRTPEPFLCDRQYPVFLSANSTFSQPPPWRCRQSRRQGWSRKQPGHRQRPRAPHPSSGPETPACGCGRQSRQAHQW